MCRPVAIKMRAEDYFCWNVQVYFLLLLFSVIFFNDIYTSNFNTVKVASRELFTWTWHSEWCQKAPAETSFSSQFFFFSLSSIVANVNVIIFLCTILNKINKSKDKIQSRIEERKLDFIFIVDLWINQLKYEVMLNVNTCTYVNIFSLIFFFTEIHHAGNVEHC